ncbi:MAG: peptidoglycan-binding domain-containing protein, partial [Bacteroidota bacterium]
MSKKPKQFAPKTPRPEPKPVYAPVGDTIDQFGSMEAEFDWMPAIAPPMLFPSHSPAKQPSRYQIRQLPPQRPLHEVIGLPAGQGIAITKTYRISGIQFLPKSMRTALHKAVRQNPKRIQTAGFDTHILFDEVTDATLGLAFSDHLLTHRKYRLAYMLYCLQFLFLKYGGKEAKLSGATPTGEFRMDFGRDWLKFFGRVMPILKEKRLLSGREGDFLNSLNAGFVLFKKEERKGGKLQSPQFRAFRLFRAMVQNGMYTLGFGDQRAEVAVLQQVLKGLKFLPKKFKVTGVYGIRTLKAVEAFQRGHAIHTEEPAGTLEGNTLLHLDEAWLNSDASTGKAWLMTGRKKQRYLGEFIIYDIPVSQRRGFMGDAAHAYRKIYDLPLQTVLRRKDLFGKPLVYLKSRKPKQFSRADVRRGWATIYIEKSQFEWVTAQLKKDKVAHNPKQMDFKPALRSALSDVEAIQEVYALSNHLTQVLNNLRIKLQKTTKTNVYKHPTYVAEREKWMKKRKALMDKYGLKSTLGHQKHFDNFHSLFSLVALETGRELMSRNLSSTLRFEMDFQEGWTTEPNRNEKAKTKAEGKNGMDKRTRKKEMRRTTYANALIKIVYDLG